jgi:peptide/nickel transport system substrate-binding protein
MKVHKPTRRMVGLITVVLVLAASCSQGGDETSVEGDGRQAEPVEELIVDSPDEEPVRGGTLRYGLEADVDGLNPTASAISAPGYLMTYAVFDTLAALDEEGKPVPWLAESFTPGEDGRTWTIKVRPNITFHDGTPLNADALIAGFQKQVNDPLVGLAIRPFFPEDTTQAVTKVDDLSVTFNLLEPNWGFPAALATQAGMVASPAWLDAALADPTLDQQPVGTGPFKFDSRSQNSITRFVRNDDWWGGDVYLDAIEFVPVPDDGTRVDLMLKGNIDAMHSTDPDGIEALHDSDDINHVQNDRSEEQFVMLNTSKPPFDDIRARKALALTTPRQNYLDLIGLGSYRPADSMETPESKFKNPDVKQEVDDPDAAAPLVAEYCAAVPAQCTDGKINFEHQRAGPSVVDTRVSEVLAQGWGSHFNVRLAEVPQDTLIQNAALGQFNSNQWRQFGASDIAIDAVWLMCKTIGNISINWPRYCDEERDQTLYQIMATPDDDARVPLMQQLQQQIHDAYTYVFLNHTPWNNAFSKDVKGVCSRTNPEGVKLRCMSNGVTWHNQVWLAR